MAQYGDIIIVAVVTALWCLLLGVADWLEDLDRYFNRKH